MDFLRKTRIVSTKAPKEDGHKTPGLAEGSTNRKVCQCAEWLVSRRLVTVMKHIPSNPSLFKSPRSASEIPKRAPYSPAPETIILVVMLSVGATLSCNITMCLNRNEEELPSKNLRHLRYNRPYSTTTWFLNVENTFYNIG